jgi:hypothetical protein
MSIAGTASPTGPVDSLTPNTWPINILQKDTATELMCHFFLSAATYYALGLKRSFVKPAL